MWKNGGYAFITTVFRTSAHSCASVSYREISNNTFQDGLIDMFVKHAVKGRLVYIDGKLQTRRWSKPDEDGDRFSTEILLVPGGRVQFLDKPNGNGAPVQADPSTSGDTGAMPAGGDPSSLDDEIPF